jgi:hypothetical protein
MRAGTALVIAALGLGGCMQAAPVPVSHPVISAPPARPAPATDPLAQYYAGIETQRLARGLLRRDEGREIALTSGQVADTWAEIALHEEYLQTRRGFSPSRNAVPLRRWAQPVRYRMEFGATLDASTQARDHAAVASLVARMAQAAGHPMSLAPLGAGAGAGNFHVLVLSEDERRAAAPALRALIPGIDEAALRLITDMPRDTFCLAMAFSRQGGSVYSEAVAIIRAEHPDLSRLSCYHEELAQGLGLANDSPRARPSIFNDDQEFALITWLDLALIRIHYDPRLSPGMTLEQALPIARVIAFELVGGES